MSVLIGQLEEEATLSGHNRIKTLSPLSQLLFNESSSYSLMWVLCYCFSIRFKPSSQHKTSNVVVTEIDFQILSMRFQSSFIVVGGFIHAGSRVARVSFIPSEVHERKWVTTMSEEEEGWNTSLNSQSTGGLWCDALFIISLKESEWRLHTCYKIRK